MEHRGQTPTLKLGDACLLVLRSNPAIPTRAVNNHNQLEPRCKQVAEFTSPGGTSLWHYWWPQSGSPKLKDSQDRSGKGPFTVKDKVIMQNKSSHCKGDRLQRKPFHFPSPSIFPIHPDAQSPHPDTSIESSLPPQISALGRRIHTCWHGRCQAQWYISGPLNEVYLHWGITEGWAF